MDEYYRIRGAKKATGSPYFSSLADADPVTVSALELLERESNLIDAEIREGLSRNL